MHTRRVQLRLLGTRQLARLWCAVEVSRHTCGPSLSTSTNVCEVSRHTCGVQSRPLYKVSGPRSSHMRLYVFCVRHVSGELIGIISLPPGSVLLMNFFMEMQRVLLIHWYRFQVMLDQQVYHDDRMWLSLAFSDTKINHVTLIIGPQQCPECLQELYEPDRWHLWHFQCRCFRSPQSPSRELTRQRVEREDGFKALRAWKKLCLSLQ